MMRFILAVLLLTKYSNFNARADADVDWSSFEVQALVHGQENLDIVRKLPIQQYWDVQKGSFRSGLIGETISNVFPQFVSHVERKVVKGGRVLGADSHVVDTTSLFMCSLSAVQELISVESQLSAKHNMFLSASDDNSTYTGDNVECSLEDLETQQQALQLQSVNMQQLLVNHKFTQDSATRLLALRKSHKLTHSLNVHTDLLATLTAHLSGLNSSRAKKFSSLLDVAQRTELSRRLLKKNYLVSQHEADAQALRQTINITMQAVSFRAAAELAAAKAQRTFEEGQLLATRTELLQAEVETLIDTFFEEMYGYVAYVQTNPAVAVLVLRNALLGVFLILLVFEVGNLVLLVSRKLSANSFLPKVVRLKGSSALRNGTNSSNKTNSPSLVWALAADRQLHRALQAVSVATTHRLPLPNLLVSGPAGSGKSSMCQAILQHIAQVASAAPHAPAAVAVSSLVVCGADLQALGNGMATGFLNDLISKYSRQRREALVLVIDDADCIVAARDNNNGGKYGNQDGLEIGRDGKFGSSNGSNANGSLFALLTGLRENSPFVSVVMTVRLPVRSLDVAVLDRLDHCIELSLPSAEQRLLYLLGCLAALRRKSQPQPLSSFSSSSSSSSPADSCSSSSPALQGLAADHLWVDWAAVEPALSESPNNSMAGDHANTSTSGSTAATAQLLHRVYAADPEQMWSNSSNSSSSPDLASTLLRQLESSGASATAATDASDATQTMMMSSSTNNSSNNTNRNRHTTTGSNSSSSSGSRSCPEMDLPEDDRTAAAAAATTSVADAGALTLLLRTCLANAPTDSFQVLPCLRLALLVSDGWSYRDLKQLFSALNYTILCSDRCQISNQIWLQELIYSME